MHYFVLFVLVSAVSCSVVRDGVQTEDRVERIKRQLTKVAGELLEIALKDAEVVAAKEAEQIGSKTLETLVEEAYKPNILVEEAYKPNILVEEARKTDIVVEEVNEHALNEGVDNVVEHINKHALKEGLERLSEPNSAHTSSVSMQVMLGTVIMTLVKIMI